MATQENRCGCISATIGRIGSNIGASVGRIGGNINATISLVCSVNTPLLVVVVPNEVTFTYEGGVAVVNVQCNGSWEVL